MSDYPTLEKLFYSDSSSERVEHVKAEAERRLNNPASFRTGIELSSGELFLATPRELSSPQREDASGGSAKCPSFGGDLPGIARWGVLAQPHHGRDHVHQRDGRCPQLPAADRGGARKRGGEAADEGGKAVQGIRQPLPGAHRFEPRVPSNTCRHQGRFTTRWWPNAIDDRDLPDGEAVPGRARGREVGEPEDASHGSGSGKQDRRG